MKTSLHRPQKTSHGGDGRRRQGGAYAVEYAFIFPVFFLLFYATLAYGMIFTMRLGLQHAAEEGARAALRFPDVLPGQNQLVLRSEEAARVAQFRASWLDGLSQPDVDAQICQIGAAGDACAEGGATGPLDVGDCGELLDESCQVVVTVTYNYAQNPVFPSLPGFGLLFPDNLQGRARALLDGRALNL